jgi:hypothetical protein
MKKILLPVIFLLSAVSAYALDPIAQNYVIKKGVGQLTAQSQVYDNGTSVGIGSSSPTAKLDVNGTVKASLFSGSGASLTNLPASGINWQDVKNMELQSAGINWQDVINSQLAQAGINWQDIKVNNIGINWTDIFALSSSSGLSGLTAGYVPVADSSSSIVNSNIYINGSNIGIGTTVPRGALDVDGAIYQGMTGSSLNSFVWCGANAAGTSPQCGTLQSRDYGSGNASNNIVFKSDNNSNIRIISPSAERHVGISIGGENLGYSNFTIMSDGSTNTYTQWRGWNMMTGNDTTEYAQFLMNSTGGTLSTLKGDLSYGPYSGSNIFYLRHSSAGNRPSAILRRAKGTSSDAAVVSGDVVGDFAWQAYDGTAYNSASLIRGLVDSTVTTGHTPTAITFQTGTVLADRTERMRITSSGNVGIGTTSPLAKLEVDGSIYIPAANLTRGYSLCMASTGIMGHCTSLTVLDGTCVCVPN